MVRLHARVNDIKYTVPLALARASAFAPLSSACPAPGSLERRKPRTPKALAYSASWLVQARPRRNRRRCVRSGSPFRQARGV